MTVAVATEPGVVLRPLRRTEYDSLVETGALEDEPVELLEGVLVEVSPQGGRHMHVITELNRLLVRRLRDDLTVRPGGPYVADDLSEPEPDVAVVPRRPGTAHPDSAVLVIEVSRSSLASDLGVKARVYARSGVPVYWVVDLVHDVVHVHTGPRGEGWTSVVQQGFDEPLHVEGVTVVLADLLT